MYSVRWLFFRCKIPNKNQVCKKNSYKLPNNVATTSEAGLMSATDKTKLNGIAAGAQVNPAYATVDIISTYPSNTEGHYQTGACNSGSYNNSVGTSNTVARGDHKHSVYIPNATTSKPGLMSKEDKANLEYLSGNLRVIYVAKISVSTNKNITKTYEKAVPGVTVTYAVNPSDSAGLSVQVMTTQSKFSYIVPVLTGQSNSPVFFDGDQGNGNFRVRQRNGNSDVLLGGGFSIVLLGV